MKKFIVVLSFVLLAFSLAGITIPRVYVQKLVLNDGSNPVVTATEKKSANEYVLRAWMQANPDEVISTETHPIHTIAIKEVGDGMKFSKTVIVSIQLGNFKRQWQAGDTMHMMLTHKASGQTKGWQIVIPEGTNLIKLLDEPLVIPPYKQK
ncbi:MAG: hypothetical protein PHO85_04670 [Candidatus Cloacimonetes bacterium]|nr:hypothetical protein [Candidatus Cloacimonadota bacterium]MDD2506304.1 hypothetical protein [Candidatus Cloacimonadota bacterium]MDD4147794.1 hypothetical protein [Candidatus Cloacimonadota bacterium]MDD4559876.1 hypothetical protein [Candidatus Cloacimonadota bacterium]